MKIEKCPFCGGEAMLTQEDCLGYYHDTWMVFCEACDLYIGFAKQYTKEEAIDAWNRRAGDDTNVATNADRIRSMSDEELAKTLAYGDFFYEEICGSDERTRVCDNDCVVCTLDWLRQPIREEHYEDD